MQMFQHDLQRHRKAFKEDMIGAGNNYRRNNEVRLMKRCFVPRSPQPDNLLYNQSHRHYRYCFSHVQKKKKNFYKVDHIDEINNIMILWKY